MAERLKLRARDAADMDVLAALLQDAILSPAEMTFQRRERRFVLLANRFMWERAEATRADATQAAATQAAITQAAAAGPAGEADARFEEAEATSRRYWRSRSGLTFDRVKAVSRRDLPDGPEALLNLLTIASEPRRITLHFSGGGQLRLDVAEIRCHLEDLGDPWPTPALPRHEAADTEETGAAGGGAA